MQPVADVGGILESVARVGETTLAADLVARMEATGVAYLVGEGGEVVGVLVGPDAYDRLLTIGRQGRG